MDEVTCYNELVTTGSFEKNRSKVCCSERLQPLGASSSYVVHHRHHPDISCAYGSWHDGLVSGADTYRAIDSVQVVVHLLLRGVVVIDDIS